MTARAAADEVEIIDRYELNPYEDVIDYLERYARQNPAAVAMFCFGLGFIFGWKLKPW